MFTFPTGGFVSQWSQLANHGKHLMCHISAYSLHLNTQLGQSKPSPIWKGSCVHHIRLGQHAADRTEPLDLHSWARSLACFADARWAIRGRLGMWCLRQVFFVALAFFSFFHRLYFCFHSHLSFFCPNPVLHCEICKFDVCGQCQVSISEQNLVVLILMLGTVQVQTGWSSGGCCRAEWCWMAWRWHF